ncbi:hypothetical protein DP939_41015 [Spongiactinospora rosea]|uniref:Uncharacterized protein n=1 Tax=Spongiactinospora rosea TaxID=2248750 RepID=A0A366LM12_9ACTN|nr:hypothetical protein [Spongiactinospora rosea]RBQ14344.1 hypothetical protein DP939_41015 [Spongiactinospora rosea]
MPYDKPAELALDFSVREDPERRKREDELDLATAPGYQLFFSCFVGDVDLRLDGLNFRTNFGWVATLSFAVGFAWRLSGLPAAGRMSMDFLEDDEWLSLRFDDGRVLVASSYARGIAVVPYADLLKLARDSLTRHADALMAAYPRLAENRILAGRLAMVLGGPAPGA